MLVHHKIDESKIIEHSVPVDQIPSLMNMFASLLAKWKTPKVEVPVLQQILQLRDKNKNIKKYEVIIALHISNVPVRTLNASRRCQNHIILILVWRIYIKV